MKRFLLLFLTMLMIGGIAKGGEGFTVNDINLPLGGEAELQVAYNFEARDCKGFQFNIDLPEGLEFVTNSSGGLVYAQGFYSESKIDLSIKNDGSLFVTWVLKNNPIHRKVGILVALKVKVKDDQEVNVNDEFNCKLRDAIRTLPNGQDEDLAPQSFKVKITDAVDYVLIDENSLFEPSSSGKFTKNVLVKRTLKEGKWNTICLPFDMTQDQLKATFGDDVKVAAFNSWTYDDVVNSVNIDFTTVPSISYGVPYIIKVSSPISQFELKKIYIRPTLNPTSKKAEYDCSGVMNGNFVYSTMEDKDLFIQDNKFFYSIQGQTIKGLRATFRFKDWDNQVIAASRGMLSIDGSVVGGNDGSTGINSNSFIEAKTGKVYSMTGTYMGEMEDMNRLPKGVYIVDGKKVVKK